MSLFRISALTSALMLASITTLPVMANQTEYQVQRISFDIPTNQIKQALNQFASTASVQLFVKDELVSGLTVQPLLGHYQPQEALDILLRNTSLIAVWKTPSAVIISKAKTKAVMKPVSQKSVAKKIAVEQPMEVIHVSASRTQLGLSSLSRQTTYIGGEELARRFSTSENLAQILGKLIPGMAPSGQTMTNFGLTLRGRNLLVLIDGIPLNTNRNVSRDLFNLNSATIESIEVVRGGNAIYGSGATGGVMYITTKLARDDGLQTRLKVNTSLTEIDADAVGYDIGQSFTGQQDDLAFRLDLDAQTRTGSYDAHGNRVAPEPSQGDLFDTQSYSVFAKLAYAVDELQTIETSLLWFEAEQDTNYASDPSVADFPLLSVPAKVRYGLELEEQNQANNLVFNLAYQNQDLFGHLVNSQVYYRDYQTRFYPFDGRPYAGWAHLGQVHLDTEVYGARLLLSYQNNEHRISYGVDINKESTAMPITAYDPKIFEQSDGLVFKAIGDKTFMPETDTGSIGTFAQYTYNFSFGLKFDAGLRHESVSVSFDDFTTLGRQNTVSGGELDYSDTLFNISLDYQLADSIGAYIAFNQGFELPDIGLQLRYANDEFTIKDSKLKPVTSDNSEIGLRYLDEKTTINLALFHSTSDQGRVKTEGFGWQLRRDEEKIKGLEFELQHWLTDDLQISLFAAKLVGEEKSESATEWRDMNGFRIPPFKTGFNINYRYENINFYSQLNYVGSEDYRIDGQDSFGRHQVDSYITLDISTRIHFTDSSLEVAIENATNNDYYPLYSQLLRSNNNSSHIPAKGAELRVSYQYNW